MVPVKVVSEREAAVAKAAAVENMTAAKSAAMERCAAASETAAVKGSTTMKAAATVETASTMMAATAMAATVTATAMTSADFARQPIGDMLRCRRRAWIDQRKRFCALVRCGRQHQHRGCRKTQRTRKATAKTAPGICNLDHA